MGVGVRWGLGVGLGWGGGAGSGWGGEWGSVVFGSGPGRSLGAAPGEAESTARPFANACEKSWSSTTQHLSSLSSAVSPGVVGCDPGLGSRLGPGLGLRPLQCRSASGSVLGLRLLGLGLSVLLGSGPARESGRVLVRGLQLRLGLESVAGSGVSGRLSSMQESVYGPHTKRGIGTEEEGDKGGRHTPNRR